MPATSIPSIDPKLSEEGEARAKKLADQVGSFPELVVTSPLSCALQTALLIFGSLKQKIHPHKLLRETPKALVRAQSVGKPQKDECKGRAKDELLDDAVLTKLGARERILWDELHPDQWWSSIILSTEQTCREGAQFREWLLGRPESRIAIVGHAAQFCNMVQSRPSDHWPKSTVPYFCYLVIESTGTLTRGDLLYGGATPQAAAAVMPKGVRSKCVLLVRSGRTTAQADSIDKPQRKRCSSGTCDPPQKKHNSGKYVPVPVAASTPTTRKPLHSNMSHVMVSGIEKKPELNGKIGQIVSFEGGDDRRYRVSIAGSLLSLREDKLAAVPAPSQGVASARGAKTTPAKACAEDPEEESAGSGIESFDKLPLGKLTAQGSLIPSYSWVKVPSVAALPPGMEVRMPFDGLKCARIPSTWRLQIVVEGQCDAYRCDVGKRTPISSVIKGAAAAFGWEEKKLELLDGGALLTLGAKATIGSAALFGRKLTARKRI